MAQHNGNGSQFSMYKGNDIVGYGTDRPRRQNVAVNHQYFTAPSTHYVFGRPGIYCIQIDSTVRYGVPGSNFLNMSQRYMFKF